jgi:hypothetical protein
VVLGSNTKRDEERIRRNKRPEHFHLDQESFSDLPFEVELLVEPPAADQDWHPIALMQYEQMLKDPARTWMGPADWGLFYLICESISRELRPQAIGVVDGGYDPETGEYVVGHVAREVVPIKGATLNALVKVYSGLGVTEAARLVLRREITFNERQKPTSVSDADVVQIRPGHFSEGPPE